MMIDVVSLKACLVPHGSTKIRWTIGCPKSWHCRIPALLHLRPACEIPFPTWVWQKNTRKKRIVRLNMVEYGFTQFLWLRPPFIAWQQASRLQPLDQRLDSVGWQEIVRFNFLSPKCEIRWNKSSTNESKCFIAMLGCQRVESFTTGVKTWAINIPIRPLALRTQVQCCRPTRFDRSDVCENMKKLGQWPAIMVGKWRYQWDLQPTELRHANIKESCINHESLSKWCEIGIELSEHPNV